MSSRISLDRLQHHTAAVVRFFPHPSHVWSFSAVDSPMGSSVVAPPSPSIALHRLPALLFSPFPAFAFCLLAVTPPFRACPAGDPCIYTCTSRCQLGFPQPRSSQKTLLAVEGDRTISARSVGCVWDHQEALVLHQGQAVGGKALDGCSAPEVLSLLGAKCPALPLKLDTVTEGTER